MLNAALIPWLDPALIIGSAGPWALLVVCLIVFAETGLLIGFLFPGDTLLVISGLLAHTNDVFGVSIWVVAGLIALSALVGGEVGYTIGHRGGPALFERKESGLFSIKNVERTNAFFNRYGGITVILARFVPVVRTFTPVAAGIGHMNRRVYSLYNAIGAVLWGFGLTMLGYVIAYIPWISDFVTEYIDVILLAAVVGSAGIVVWHYLSSRHAAAKIRAVGGDDVTDADEAALLVLEAEVFDAPPAIFLGDSAEGQDPSAPHPRP